MKVLLLGSGGREHALAWKMAQSPLLNTLYIAPGNGGTKNIGVNVQLDISNFEAIHQFCVENQISLIVCGPEQPLVDGIADFFKEKDIQVIGPSQEGAKLEGSKSYAKHFMQENHIPTAQYGVFTNEQIEEANAFLDQMPTPIVLKADGLAAGKGVLILNSRQEAKSALKVMFDGQFGQASQTVVIEHFLTGIEFSVFVLTDGKDHMLLPVAKDYKRIGEADTGPNTGGMGTVSPPPFVDQTLMDKVSERIIKPTLQGLQNRQIDYKGFIFFGLIAVDGDPFVIEYNCRLGDPETQVILPRIQNDLLSCFIAVFDGSLKNHVSLSTDQTCVAVVLASGGYPEAYEKGKSIQIQRELMEHETIFHAGTKDENEALLTSGGRVLACCALAPDLPQARNKAYDLVNEVNFEAMYYRKDIGVDLITHV